MLQRGVETNPKSLKKAQRVFNRDAHMMWPLGMALLSMNSLGTLKLKPCYQLHKHSNYIPPHSSIQVVRPLNPTLLSCFQVQTG